MNPTLQFGFFLLPTTDFAKHRKLVHAAEAGGLDLVGVQDHPYSPDFVDSLALIGALLHQTSRLRFFSDVANLPLRPPAMLASTAATLDLTSGGRFELGIGAGSFWKAITTMGVDQLSPAESLEALGEAVEILRALWRPGGERLHVAGRHYRLDGVRSGPAPAHDIGIWLGGAGPRSQRLTGQVADGWAAPIPSYLPYEKWQEANRRIDLAAEEAGRKPSDILRMVQLVGTIQPDKGDFPTEGTAPLRGTAQQWAQYLAELAVRLPFRTFILGPEEPSVDQVTRFAEEVVPEVRRLLA